MVMPMGKEVKMVFFSNIQREMNFSVIPKKISLVKLSRSVFQGKHVNSPMKLELRVF